MDQFQESIVWKRNFLARPTLGSNWFHQIDNGCKIVKWVKAPLIRDFLWLFCSFKWFTYEFIPESLECMYTIHMSVAWASSRNFVVYKGRGHSIKLRERSHVYCSWHRKSRKNYCKFDDKRGPRGSTFLRNGQSSFNGTSRTTGLGNSSRVYYFSNWSNLCRLSFQ